MCSDITELPNKNLKGIQLKRFGLTQIYSYKRYQNVKIDQPEMK